MKSFLRPKLIFPLVTILLLAGASLVALGDPLLRSYAQGPSVSVTIPGAQPWTDTGIDLTTGVSVSITASGIVYIDQSASGRPQTPDGVANCIADPGNVAPGLPCVSLIGRIANGTPFEVGSSVSFTASSSGRLYLGVNDNIFYDNSGSWTAQITITPPDTTAPTLILPSTTTVRAPSPQGAVVTYAVTATDADNQPSELTINCSPSSGSTFPIGTTTVNCHASDPAGNSSTGSFQVVIKGAAAQLSDLSNLLNSFNLSPQGIQTSFDNQLQIVQADLAANNTAQACSDLTSFNNHVNAQSGKHLTTDQATQLLTATNNIGKVLSC